MQPWFSEEELRERADLVVIAEVTSSEVRWAEGRRGGLETVVWLATTAGETLEIVLPGGEKDGHYTRVEDVPRLLPDRSYLLHLIATPQGWQVLGGEQGAVRVGTPVFQWDTNANDWAWADAPAPEPFEINLDTFSDLGSADAEAAFADALAVWNVEASAHLYLENGGDSPETQQGGGDDDHNVTIYGDWTWGAGLAVATTNGYDGDLSDCDIQVWEGNSYGSIDWHLGLDAAPADTFDIRNTLTHEIGHCLGMAHSDVENAIMYGYNVDGTGEDRRHLHDDDIAGIQSLYGEVAPELEAEATVEPLPEPGSPFDLVVTVRNVGDGTAWDVIVGVGASPPFGSGQASLEVLPAPTAVGAKIGPAEAVVRVPLEVGPNCDAASADLVLTLSARDAGPWEVPVTIPTRCVAEDDRSVDEGPEWDGCACSSRGGLAGPWLLALLGLVARRRYSPVSATGTDCR
jgi:hypothetical protein